MRKSATLTAIVLSLASAASHADTVLNFDSIPLDHLANFGPDFGVVSNGYGGLNWLNAIVEPESSYIPGSLNMNVSLPNVATDSNYLGYALNAAPIQFSSDTPFDLKSVYLISNQVEGLNIQVQGILDGVIVDTTTFTAGTQAPVLATFGWTVDTVVMTTTGSSDPSKHQSFSFDNLVISAVPAPNAGALALAGLGFVWLATRRKARGAGGVLAA